MIDEIIPWLPLMATLIAGIFALFQIKSNNITNARIKWLDNFKQVLTDFTSECSILLLKAGVRKEIDKLKQKDNFSESDLEFARRITESTFEDLKIIESKHNLIKLNLNPKENLHIKLEDLLDNYMKLFNQIPIVKGTENYNTLTRKMDAYSETIILLIRYIMKLEWEKTKRTYLSRKCYMNFGEGKKILTEALNLNLLPERKYE